MREDKEAMAQLRRERKESIDRAREAMKEQKSLISAIKDRLKKEPATVPQLAQVLGEDTAQVLLFVSGLRKYGEVMEGEKVDGYFSYRLVAAEGGEQ